MSKFSLHTGWHTGSLRLFWLATLTAWLLLLIFPSTPAAADDSPPPLGPGWHTGSAGNVPPSEARAILDSSPAARSSNPASEAEITPEIQAIADGLGNDPARIFDLVHNHIEYVPTFGAMNGATATFQARRGNDWDQAALLVALLRASGISAGYVEGDVIYSPESLSAWLGIPTNVNVAASILAVGGVPSEFSQNPFGVKVTRVWVEAQIGGQTVTLDPAFKRHTVFVGLENLAELMGYNREIFLQRALQGTTSSADSIQKLNEANIRADLTTLSLNLNAEIEATLPEAHLHEIIGGATIDETRTETFGSQLPEALQVTVNSRFPVIPANRRHTLRIQHAGLDRTFATHEIANKRLSIQYDGPGNAPVLRMEGTALLTGTATTLGDDLPLQLTIDHPYAANGGSFGDQAGSQLLTSGGVFALIHDFGGVSEKVLRSRDPDQLAAVTNGAGIAVGADEVLAEVLHQMGLYFTLQKHLFTHLTGRLAGVAFVHHHTVGVAGQLESYYVDIPFGFTSSTPARPGAEGVAAFRTLALMSSAFEHGVLEQAQGTDRPAVSAVKLLTVNNRNGDKTFLANAVNFEAIKPQLTGYSAELLDILQAAVDSGRTLVLPQNGEIIIGQYEGSGYVDDLRVGSSSRTGMIIFGGLFGGFSTVPGQANGELQDKNSRMDDAATGYKNVVSKSKDPVEMAEGSFVLERADLTIGSEESRRLAFARFYSSAGGADGPLGQGWHHNYDVQLDSASNGPHGLGLGQTVDTASLLTAISITLDLMPIDPSLTEWTTGLLITHWAMDQLLDNSRTVTVDNRRRTFIRRADGAFNTPAGSSERLFERGDGAQILDPTGRVWFFDSAGKLRAWTDRNANRTTLTYDGQGRLSTVSDADGNTLAYAYDGSGRLTSVTDSASRQVGFAYTTGRLTAVTDAEGAIWRYAYDTEGRMTTVFQAEEGNARSPRAAAPTVTNEYDSFGRIIRQTDGVGVVTTFGWSDFRNREVYPDATQTTHHYNERRLLTGIEDATGQRNRLVIDGRGYIRQLIDKLGATELYTYSLPAGMLAAITDGEGATQSYLFASRSQTITHPLSPTLSFAFVFQELTRIDYPDGTSESFQRDGRGNVTRWTDRTDALFTYLYNGRGQPIRITNPSGGVTQISYHADATPASVSDSDTGITSYTYDSAKRVIRVDFPDGTNEQYVYDANDLLTRFSDGKGTISRSTFDANRNATQIVRGVGTGVEQMTAFEYDALDRLTRLVDPAGNPIQFSYTFFGGLDKATLPDGTALDVDYDSRQRVAQVTLPTGQTVAIQQNDEGLLTGARFPSGRAVAISSDRRGLYTEIVDPIGRGATLRRNPVGRVVSVQDRLGNAVSIEYDGNGRLLGITTPVIGTVRYLRNGLGNLTEIRTLTGNSWLFDNSTMGRRTRLTDPLGNQWQYAYDARGRLATTTHPDGETESRSYDDNGNLTQRAFSGGLTLGYNYDALNRLTATASAAVSLAYDSRDNVTATTMHGVTVETTYDANNRIKSVKYGDALTVFYTYNAKGQVTKISDSLSGGSVEYEYDADGLIVVIRRANGIHTEFSRDANGRITRIRHGNLGTIEIDYDAEDNVLRLLEALPDDASAVLAQQVQSLLFDQAEQIVSPGFTHDKRGRRTADNGRSYTWDGADRLAAISQAGVNTAFEYTALGEASTRTVNGVVTDFLYNYAQAGRPLIGELRNGGFIRAYVYAPGGALLYFVDVPLGKAFFYHFNQVGTTLFLTDGVGQVSDTYGYSIFGEMKTHNGPNREQLFTFVGELGVRREGDTGLYQMRARYYDSSTLRFLSREPLWPLLDFPQALNPYQYAFGNPLRFVDPSGLHPEVLAAIQLARAAAAKNHEPAIGEHLSKPNFNATKALNGVLQSAQQIGQRPNGQTDASIGAENVQSLLTSVQNGGSVQPNTASSQQMRDKFLGSYISSSSNQPDVFKGVHQIRLTEEDRETEIYLLSEYSKSSPFGCECSCSIVENKNLPLGAEQTLPLVAGMTLLLVLALLRRRRAGKASSEEKETPDVS